MKKLIPIFFVLNFSFVNAQVSFGTDVGVLNSGVKINGIAITDVNALAYIKAAQITNLAQKIAVNNVCIALKNASMFNTQVLVFYPFLGGSDYSNKYNLIDTATFKITWTGTVNNCNFGFYPDGFTSIGNTSFIPSVNCTSGNHASFFSASNNVNNRAQLDLGTFENTASKFLILSALYRNGGLNATVARNTSASVLQTGSNPNINTIGYFLTNSLSGTNFLDVNGSQVDTKVDVGTLPSTYAVLLGCYQNAFLGGAGFSNRGFFACTLGNGLTPTQRTTLNTIVQKFVTDCNKPMDNVYFMGDSYTQGNYGGITPANRYSSLTSVSEGYEQINLAVSGQSLTFCSSSSSNFDTTQIPNKSQWDKKIIFCWSMLNEIGTTVTCGAGSPFTNTAHNCANNFRTILQYAHNTKGWAYADMTFAGDFYAYPVPSGGPNAPLQSDVYMYADSVKAAATGLGVPVISHRAYMVANGMNALLTSTVVPYNDHPNLNAQAVIAQNLINNL